MGDQLAYTRDEAAAALRISKDKVDAAIRTGALRAKRVGRTIVIPARALTEYLEHLPDA